MGSTSGMAREAVPKDLIEPEGVNAGPPVTSDGEDAAEGREHPRVGRPTPEAPTGGDNGELLSRPAETRTTPPPQPGQQTEVGEG